MARPKLTTREEGMALAYATMPAVSARHEKVRRDLGGNVCLGGPVSPAEQARLTGGKHFSPTAAAGHARIFGGHSQELLSPRTAMLKATVMGVTQSSPRGLLITRASDMYRSQLHLLSDEPRSPSSSQRSGRPDQAQARAPRSMSLERSHRGGDSTPQSSVRRQRAASVTSASSRHTSPRVDVRAPTSVSTRPSTSRAWSYVYSRASSVDGAARNAWASPTPFATTSASYGAGATAMSAPASPATNVPYHMSSSFRLPDVSVLLERPSAAPVGRPIVHAIMPTAEDLLDTATYACKSAIAHERRKLCFSGSLD
ncbi:hypothetical protein EON62_01815, partial [archaeon]